MILALLSAAALQPAAGGWRVEEAEAVWRAQPDERPGLRIRCRNRGLELLGPAAPDARPSVPTSVTFRHGDDHVTLVAVPVDSDDGLLFSVPVRAGELPIATLLAGDALTVSQSGEDAEIPGTGAPAVLAPLVEVCGR